MDDFTNGYFEEMKSVIKDYQLKKEVRSKEHEHLLHNKDYEGLEQWQQRENTITFPFNKAHMVAYKDWEKSKENDSNYFECDNLPWPDEISDYARIVRDAEIHEIAVTDFRARLISRLHAFKEFGYDVISLCEVIHYEKRWDGIEIITIPGILLSDSDDSYS